MQRKLLKQIKVVDSLSVITVFLMLCTAFYGPAAFGDLIIDNGDAGTTFIGTWAPSGATNSYGPDSLWSRDGDTYTWNFGTQTSGTYEVLMWWTQWPSRSTNIPIDITHAGGTSRFYINQQTNGGKWNSLGQFTFTSGSGHKVMITSQAYPSSTCADAVWFKTAEASSGIVIDNLDTQTSKVGTWDVSGATGAFGPDSVWSRDGSTFSWQFSPPSTGNYKLSMWWTQWPSRSIAVPVAIHNASGTANVIINQQVNGGKWNEIGTYPFNAGTTYNITITAQPGPSSTCADAIKFDLTEGNQSPIATIDSITPNPAVIGQEVSFVGHGQDTDGTIKSYRWESNLDGVLNTSATFNTSNLSAGNHVITFKVTDDKDAVSVAATANLMINVPANISPTAFIDSITPNPATVDQAVSFVGHGQDSDGTIKSYLWESSIDGTLSNAATFNTSNLSSGNHIISLKVTDNQDAVSASATANLVINGEFTEKIIDNRDSATSKIGTWDVSGATGYYGQDSVWSRDGATFSYLLTVPESGNYEIWMWWTQWSTRSTTVPVDIQNSAGTTRVTVNQQANGGKWNSLGTYSFQANTAYEIKITSQPGPSSTCADAIRCTKGSAPSAPVADFTATPTSGAMPLTVQFTDQSTGSITQRQWNFGDGQTSNQQNPSHIFNNSGAYNVSLTVTGTNGSDIETKTAYINVTASNTENIYLCDTYAGGPNFIPNAMTMLRRIGATETSTGVWQYKRAGMTYNIYAVHSPEAMEAALKEKGSHVIIEGHANFGFGSTFASNKETIDQQISGLYYVDDDRFVNYSTDMVSTKVDGMKYGQAYPDWNPVFKNGNSAIMPYTFAQGTPPYNYYLTYTVPGDPQTYKIELGAGKYLQRFPDSATPAWFSATGAKPNPVNNPEYFIVNNENDYNRCTYVGSWPMKKVKNGGYTGAAGYLGYNYQVHWPGNGGNKAIWNLVVKYPGYYTVLASWYPDPTNATNAPFIINHTGGSDTVYANQRVTNLVNPLGTFMFDTGSYTIELNDKANGQVVADAMVLSAYANPPKILQSEFDASVQSGSAPLNVQFSALNAYYSLSDPVGDVNQWYWDFGDGTTSTDKSPLHTYTTPGIYSVSLRVVDKSGAEQTEIKNNLIVVDTTPPLEAEFTSASRIGSDKTVVTFKNLSSGNITGWLWDFGDGTTSTEQNPLHVYTEPKSYTVKLTITGPGGITDTETETDFVYNIIGLIYADNVDRTKPHFYSRATGSPITFGKVICNTGGIKIPESELGYTRMFEGSCNSFPYYAGTFHRGIMFAKVTDVETLLYTGVTYLEYYLKGASDQELLTQVNAIENNHVYYNFNLKPPSMR